MFTNIKTLYFTALGCSAAVLSSEAIVMDLDDGTVGPNEIITNQFPGLTVSVFVNSYDSPVRPMNAVIFDTSDFQNNDSSGSGATGAGAGFGDSDLVNYGPITDPNTTTTRWRGGNLEGDNSVSTNILILQEDNGGTYTGAPAGFINDGFADDISQPGAGSYFLLTFATAINEFQVDWMDSDSSALEHYSFTFTDVDKGVSAEIEFDYFTTDALALGSGGGLFDDTIVSGDHFANRLPLLTIASINAAVGTALEEIDTVQINMDGSGGFANVTYSVPEPSSYALVFGSVMLGLAISRRRR